MKLFEATTVLGTKIWIALDHVVVVANVENECAVFLSARGDDLRIRISEEDGARLLEVMRELP